LTAGRAHGFTDPYVLPKTTVAPPPAVAADAPGSYPVEAISGADGVASNGVPLKKAFDDLVETTRDHAPTCMFPFLIGLKIVGLTGTSVGAVWTGL